MDDDMEDEIICELFTTHIHLIWKYLSVTSNSIAEFILPHQGESMKTKMLKPGPFMIITFLIIVSSLLLQSRHNWFQKIILSCHNSINFNVVTEHNTLKNFVNSSIGSEETSCQEFVEGIVGVYAMQGRRATMEDRFCIMQGVDVGRKNKLSFFGVYDGHGGQYVAEFVKENLFTNTVNKIRQLLSSFKNDSTPRHKKNGLTKTSKNEETTKINGQSVTLTEINNINNNKITDCNNGVIQNEEDKEIEKKKKNKKNEENETCNSDNKIVGSVLEEINKEKNDKQEEDIIILKKEDPYISVNLRKKSSPAINHAASNEGAKTTNANSDSSNSAYIDSNSNINYTKLLTDQIMRIDKQIVDHCKSKTDLSGTTAVIAVLDGELLIIGNVGDSRAVMGDMKGSSIPLSFDHKPNQLKEMRRIKEAGGFITFAGVWRVAGILATSRALGDFPLKDPKKLITAEPDVLTFSLRDHKAHFVILATDGLWDVMSNEEAVQFVQKHIHEKDNGAKSLVMHAYNKGSMDNITVTILNLSKLENSV